MELIDDDWCFVCGRANPIGLRQRFSIEGDEYVTYFTPRKEHQGYQGITHGGLTATLLDEVMARFVKTTCCEAVTAEMTVRLKKPALTGQRLRFAARIKSRQRRIITATATATDDDGTLIAEATGTMIEVS